MSVAETQKLYELLKAIHDLTGVRAAVCNAEHREILAYPAESMAFCKLVCHQAGCEGCGQKQTRMIARCHAGLTKIVEPITDGNDPIGYIVLSQFVEEKDREAFMQKVLTGSAGYGAEPSQVMASAARVPQCSQTQIDSVSRIVRVAASYAVYAEVLSSAQAPLRQTIADYISKNLSEDLSIQGLCRKFSVSKTELYRLLRGFAPEGVAAYVRQKRFAKACELLRGTRKSVWQIAEEVGYDNADYFLRAFKKELGISAAKYRRSLEDEAG